MSTERTSNRRRNQIRRRNKRITNTLLIILLAAMLLTVIAFVTNIFRVRNTDTGEGETIEETEAPENEFTNEFYSIGYNATEINKTYFRELDDALDGEKAAPEVEPEENSEENSEENIGENKETVVTVDKAKVASALVKCFITEYYTWTNKDGNYDVGGMQYIFTDSQADFATYSRYNFYADMDLYLTQQGRSSLIQVKDVTVNESAKTDSFTVGETAFECWRVDASWTYEDGSSMPVSAVQNHGVFYVVDHNGRLEIASIQ